MKEKQEKNPIEIAKLFSSKMQIIKKKLQKDNMLFDKNAFADFGKNQLELEPLLREFHDIAGEMLNIQDFASIIGKEKAALVKSEYIEYIKVLEEYNVNLMALSKVGGIFIDATKKGLENSTKIQHGYNRDGTFISDKDVLDNMPPVAFNDKV